jgi:hypothetical protein
MNDYCPKIKDKCIFCTHTEVGMFCGIGIRTRSGRKNGVINKISEMKACPKLLKKESEK